MPLRHRAMALAFVSSCLLAAGCSADAREDEELSDDALSREDKEYSFRYELPENDLFAEPFTKTFPFEVQQHYITLKAKFTPTAKVSIGSPVIEGHATVGRRRLLSALLGAPVPKILDAELKATSTYSAKLDVDIELQWSKTAEKAKMNDVLRELNEKTLANAAMTLASNLGHKQVRLIAPDGTWREDMPLGVHFDVVVTCGIDELDGDLTGTFETGVEGKVVARAVYNVDGVEKRRFQRDPKQKFEIDTSEFQVTPEPKFHFKAATQHVKGSCSVQPVAVVEFAKDTGVRVRVEARSTFDTTVAARADMTPEWRLLAQPELNVWGEANLTVPIVHKTLDKTALLYSKTFAPVDVAIEEHER